MSQDLTPEHMRCDVGASCPSITRLDDGRLLIVGTDAHDLAIKYGIAPSPFEEAIVISPSLLDTLMEEARREERKLPPMVHPEGEPIVGAHGPRNLADEYMEAGGPSDGLSVGPDLSNADEPPCFVAPETKVLSKEESLKRHARPEIAAKVQALADSVKKRGRPRTKTPEERKAYRAELMRKRRAEKKGAGK